MRLTLRTLLAYLDDTLEAAEIKEIGQKVAESEAAQELMARLKQVSRSRRLTTPPPTGPGAFEPNTVADYLDNTLSPEQVAEVEKLALESDVHLAEITACHQILTLVLGEPPLIPPTAKTRMYKLVQGRAASTKRKPRATEANPLAAAPTGDGSSEADDTLLLGLPIYRRQGTMLRWLLPLAGVVLFCALAAAIYMALPSGTNKQVALRNGTNRQPTPIPSDPNKAGNGTEADKKTETNPPDGPKPIEPDKPVDPIVPPSPPRPAPPSQQRVEAGKFYLRPMQPSVLVHRTRDQERWTRLQPASRVFTDDRLVSLPGYQSELRLNSQVYMLLWGNIHPFFVPQSILESAVVLHANPADAKTVFDLDFTLDRGRVLLTNYKDGAPALVRVRFHDEVWDVTLLEPGTEVGLQLFGGFAGIPYDSGEKPWAELNLVVLKGQATVKIGYQEFLVVQDAQMSWDNKGSGVDRPGPLKPDMRKLLWDLILPTTKQAQDMKVALQELNKKLTEPAIDLVLDRQLLTSDRPGDWIVAVLSRGALDDVPKLVDALGDDKENHFQIRRAAAVALRHWAGRRAEHDKKLYDVLLQKRYSERDADTIMQLLHGFSREDLERSETWEILLLFLKDPKPAIRELAAEHVYRHVPDEAWPKVNYNAAGNSDQREAAYKAWKKVIPDGKLPPVPMAPPK